MTVSLRDFDSGGALYGREHKINLRLVGFVRDVRLRDVETLKGIREARGPAEVHFASRGRAVG